MTDLIVLQRVSARGFHGVLDVEKAEGQEFVVDVTLEVDLRRAGRTDLLAHTVSYAEVAADVVALITGPSLDLIETLADRIAAAALRRPLVQAVTVTVHKPQAPVGVPFGDVQVVVERHRDEPVVIALGANLGAVQATLEAAVRGLAEVDGLQVTAVSDLFETDPVGGPEQPAYLNAVVLGRTRLAAFSVLTELHRIEAEHGRVRETRWGARSLDCDLIQYGDPEVGSDLVSNDPELMLPHPRAQERAFVLAPWAAVDAQAVLRVDDALVPVSELLRRAEGGDGGEASGVRPGPAWSPRC
ncbi:MAG TPA: 2-amino-4-hydroxy-6-hydroxymethyldihydropteridine diphosphokinase [Dermatophilaceae bacterium]|jgi:dihydroneopterin aldolase / 2-amino-4-hydroxy-6-hydroxymethyldihydropteridine diphosphokinase